MEFKELLQSLNNSQRRESYIKRCYPELWNHLMTFPEDISWCERLYWCLNDITTYPLCKYCGKGRTKFKGPYRGGYSEYCSIRCAHLDEPVREKMKQTNLEKYGAENPFASEVIKEKIKQTNLEKYGTSIPTQNEQVKEKTRQTNLKKYGVEYYVLTKDFLEKSIATALEHYGVTNYSLTEEFKQKMKDIWPELEAKRRQTTLKKYGVECYSQSEEYKERMEDRWEEIAVKVYKARKEHGTIASSSIEQKFKQWLDEHNVNYIHQYKSDAYPFMCDFYFPDMDLYLEIQGHWSHGKHPFNPDDPEDVKLVKKWEAKGGKQYETAVDVWTFRDPIKRLCAQDHKLNWVEVFTNDLNELLFKSKIDEIVKK